MKKNRILIVRTLSVSLKRPPNTKICETCTLFTCCSPRPDTQLLWADNRPHHNYRASSSAKPFVPVISRFDASHFRNELHRTLGMNNACQPAFGFSLFFFFFFSYEIFNKSHQKKPSENRYARACALLSG